MTRAPRPLLVAVTAALEANPSAATAETKTADTATTPPAYPCAGEPATSSCTYS